MSKNRYLVVFDFLSQKYEVQYHDGITAREVIQQIQPHLFPSERDIKFTPKDNEKSCHKLNLYQVHLSKNGSYDLSDIKFVNWKITAAECDNEKYHFFLFRPFINVYLPIYIIFPEELEAERSKAFLTLIYPIKKRGIVLKNYLKDKVQQYTKDKAEFKERPIRGFILRFLSNSHELEDDEYVEPWMNGEKVLLIARTDNNINQNSCSLGRFYYISYGQVSQARVKLSRDIESLDYDERSGLTLSEAKKKLIEKHQNGNTFPDDKVIILFNSIVQTEKFARIDDLFSDNDFYQFVVIFESSDMKINPAIQSIPNEEKRLYKVAVPEDSRPYVVEFNIGERSTRELLQDIVSNDEARNELSDEIADNDNNNLIDESDSTINSNDAPNNNVNDNINVRQELILNNNTQKSDANSSQLANNQAKEELTNENNEEIVEEENNDRNNNNTDNDDNNSNFTTTTSNNDNDNNNINVINVNDKEKENYYNEEEIKEENLLDMFCYYFNEFMKERGKETRLTPKPGYFNNLSGDEKLLIQTFKKYYDLYRHTKQ
ncbi:hypothetical protein M9Y10_005567 [Tritrichomonas musculus]|uniref:Uncharacterized protein n=1 Tax=Tritrichomonas musculus TaxID=1915356 RepID=A0ABR2JCZ4_9EUKA